MNFNARDLPFNELPSMPPLRDLNYSVFHQDLIEARVALGKLEEATHHSRHTKALRVIIPIVEAKASSAIENIVTTQDKLFRATLEKAISGDSSLDAVIRYHVAMGQAESELKQRPITPALVKRVCSTILGVEMSYRDTPGTFIGMPSSEEKKSVRIYTPPEGKVVIEKLMDNLLSFINSSNMDPLVTLSLAHYQFEAIHPFSDGNGRTGRILNLLQLQTSALLTSPVLHLSRVIKDNLKLYYQLLQAATEHREYENWIKFMLQSITGAAELARTQLGDLAEYSKEIEQKADELFGSKIPEGLLDIITESPYSKISQVVERCGVTRQTAAKWLTLIEEAGFVGSIARGRDKYFVNHDVIGILKFE